MPGMKLNIGCGKSKLQGGNEGYTGIDIAKPADIISDARKIPLPDGCAKEIMAIHVFEHFYRWEAESLLEEWARLLRSNGRLILEMPDIRKCAENFLAGLVPEDNKFNIEQLGLWGMYGDPGHKKEAMVHKWGWEFKTLSPLVSAAGFDKVQECEMTLFHRVGIGIRDFRLEARRC